MFQVDLILCEKHKNIRFGNENISRLPRSSASSTDAIDERSKSAASVISKTISTGTHRSINRQPKCSNKPCQDVSEGEQLQTPNTELESIIQAVFSFF